MKRGSAFAQGYGGQGGNKNIPEPTFRLSREKKFFLSPETINFIKNKRELFFDELGVVVHGEEAADGLGVA